MKVEVYEVVKGIKRLKRVVVLREPKSTTRIKLNNLFKTKDNKND